MVQNKYISCFSTKKNQEYWMLVWHFQNVFDIYNVTPIWRRYQKELGDIYDIRNRSKIRKNIDISDI